MQKSIYIKKASKHIRKAILHVHDHFVPHERNNHKPHFLSHRALAGYSVLLILIKVMLIVAPIALPSSSLFSSAITVDNIINLTNQTRINLGLTELTTSPILNVAAYNKAQDMLLNQYFAHTSPTGLTPWEFIKKAGYNYTYAGENLAVHFVTTESVSDGWMASPTHKANIVSPNYKEIGVGVINGDYEGYPTTFVVQMFGAPLVKTESVKLASTTPVPAPVPLAEEVSQAEPVKSIAVNVTPVPVPDPIIKTEPQPAPILEENIPVVEQLTEVIKEDVVIVSSPVTINDQSLKVKWSETAYDVSIEIFNARAVSLQLGTDVVPLDFNPDTGLWSGSIPYSGNTASANGDLLSAIATAQDGSLISKSLVWVAPQVAIQDLYNFQTGNDKFVKFLGIFTIHNLDDKVTAFYFYFMLILVAALMINVLVRIRIQHFSIIGHSLVVIALALILAIV